MREHERSRDDERNVLARAREPDQSAGTDGIPYGSAGGDPEKRRGGEEHEEEREKVGIAHVLGGERVERIHRQEKAGQEAYAASEAARAEAVGQKDGRRSDQGARDAREEIERSRRRPDDVLLELWGARPSGGHRDIELVGVLEDEREIEAQGGPPARVRIRVERLGASPPHRPGASYGGAVGLLDGGVIEQMDSERWVRKPVVNAPESNRERETEQSEEQPIRAQPAAAGVAGLPRFPGRTKCFSCHR